MITSLLHLLVIGQSNPLFEVWSTLMHRLYQQLIQNIVPLISPLHIALNARECVLLIFHEIFVDFYTFLFGKGTQSLAHIIIARGYLWRMDTCQGHNSLSLWQVQGY
jgi:hypothetical protein